jgi:hypothetical protein
MDGLTGYPIQQLAETLCWEDASVEVRSIALFTLKVYAISEPSSLGNSSFQKAKVFAALAMLEHLEGCIDLEEVESLERRMQLPGYRRILEIALRRGWRPIRRLDDLETYEKNLAVRIEQSKLISEMVEFSYRFITKRSYGRKAGFTLARDFVVRKHGDTIGYGRSTITERWNSFEQGSTGVLIYLMHHPTFNLLSVHPTAGDFCRAQVENRELLKRFFAAYIAMSKKLRPHGYADVLIEIPELKGISSSIEVEDFSESDAKILMP